MADTRRSKTGPIEEFVCDRTANEGLPYRCRSRLLSVRIHDQHILFLVSHKIPLRVKSYEFLLE